MDPPKALATVQMVTMKQSGILPARLESLRSNVLAQDFTVRFREGERKVATRGQTKLAARFPGE